MWGNLAIASYFASGLIINPRILDNGAWAMCLSPLSLLHEISVDVEKGEDCYAAFSPASRTAIDAQIATCSEYRRETSNERAVNLM